MWFRISLLVVLTLSVIPTNAQDDPLIAQSDNKFVEKLRRHVPRPKFFEFKHTAVQNYNVTSQPILGDTLSNEVDINRRWALKLRAPLLLKPKFTLLTGINYRTEEFIYRTINPETGDFFSEFNSQDLSTFGLSFIGKIKRTEDKFFYFYWNGSLNSDQVSFSRFTDQLKTNVVFVAVKNISAVSQIGYGGGFGYIFGRAAVFPTFIYNTTFSEKWHLELLLPKSIKFRFMPAAETYILFSTDVTGASYFIVEQPIPGFDEQTFQRSTMEAKIQFEREIYDFLWFGASIGYNIPINQYLSEPRKRRRDAIMTLEADPALIYSFSFFMVVPKKIHYKNAKGR